MTLNSNSIEESSLFMYNIDPHQYTLTLLQFGINSGLIDDSTLISIQTDIMTLGQETILKYTRGESTSVRKETAERILTSILYSLDAQLLSLADHERALQSLCTADIIDVYHAGFGLVLSCIEEAKALLQDVANRKLLTENYAYNATIDEALPGFALYDPIYNAQSIWATIDYPLLFNDLDTNGIFFIKQYLEYLNVENYICSKFNTEDINNLLNNFGKVYRIDYRETIINILEIVLTNSTFSILSGGIARNLHITPCQYEFLCEYLGKLDPSHLSDIIDHAIDTLLAELLIDDKDIRNYVKRYPSLLLPRLISALANNNLANIIIVDSDIQIPSILWDEGSRLSDEAFRTMVDRILACFDGKEKSALIHSGIKSLSDFIDLLEADCMFDDEFYTLFTTLGDMELSILVQIVYVEELRVNGVNNLRKIIETKELEEHWQIQFTRYLLGLNSARFRALVSYISLTSKY